MLPPFNPLNGNEALRQGFHKRLHRHLPAVSAWLNSARSQYLVCAMHPTGPEERICPDLEALSLSRQDFSQDELLDGQLPPPSNPFEEEWMRFWGPTDEEMLAFWGPEDSGFGQSHSET